MLKFLRHEIPSTYCGILEFRVRIISFDTVLEGKDCIGIAVIAVLVSNP